MAYNGVTEDELCHFGIKGMKWGVRHDKKKSEAAAYKERKKILKADLNSAILGNKIQSKNGAILTRKQFKQDSPIERKKRIDADIKEADDRVKFYGSKRAAKAAINDEASFAKSVNRGKAAINTLLYGGGGGLAGSTLMALATNSAAAAAAGGAAPLLGVGLVSVAAAKRANAFIEKHKNDQMLYTDESEYGHDIVVTYKKK